MTSDERRAETAARLRELGHEFVGRDLSVADLEEVARRAQALLDLVRGAPPKVRTIPNGTLEHFTMAVPDAHTVEKHQLFTDSFVSGGANPMGLGAVLWREGETALAFTAQLDITYLAPTPVHEAITARAWLESRQGRKLTIKAAVRSADLVVAEATGLFVSVDPAKFLAHLARS